MRRAAIRGSVAVCVMVAVGMMHAQTPTAAISGSVSGTESAPPAQTSPTAQAGDQNVVGGKLHGVVKSGNVPLPGVTVTAQNTLTGKRYTTTSDITGRGR